MGAIHFSLDERLVELVKTHLSPSCFVETGTFRGDTLDMARQHFAECHSVELSPELHSAAEARFANQPGIHLMLGSSPDMLMELSPTLQDRAVLYWLDAHWCSADNTAGEDSQSPLLEEIAAIGTLHPKSVVLIDDARLYLSTPPAPHHVSDWPDIHEIFLALIAIGNGHRLAVFDDIIAFYPEALRAPLADHVHRHGVDWLKVAGDARKHQKRKKSKLRRLLGGS